MSGGWPAVRRLETRVVLVVLALAGAALGVAEPVETAAGERRQGGALLGGGGLAQVVTRDPAVGLRLLVESRDPGSRAGPPVLAGLLLAAAALAGVARLDGTVRLAARRVPAARAPAALGSRAPPPGRRR